MLRVLKPLALPFIWQKFSELKYLARPWSNSKLPSQTGKLDVLTFPCLYKICPDLAFHISSFFCKELKTFFFPRYLDLFTTFVTSKLITYRIFLQIEKRFLEFFQKRLSTPNKIPDFLVKFSDVSPNLFLKSGNPTCDL